MSRRWSRLFEMGRAKAAPFLLAGLLLCYSAGVQGQPECRCLFVLPYGTGPGQVVVPTAPRERDWAIDGPGPALVQVSRDGHIWIFDEVRGQLKVFADDGRLVKAYGQEGVAAEPVSVEREEPGPVEWWLSVCAFGVTEDRLYVLNDSREAPFLAIDAVNRPVDSRRDMYGNLIELDGAEKIVAELRREVLPTLTGLRIPAVHAVYADWAGNLHISLRAPEAESNPDDRVRGTLYVFDKLLQYVGARPGQIAGPDGCTYAVVPRRSSEAYANVDIYDPAGQFLRTVALRGPAAGWDGRIIVDAHQSIYIVSSSTRQVGTEIRPSLVLTEDLCVERYGADGHLNATLEMPGSPLSLPGGCSHIAVDGSGRVHYLDFRSDGVHVMRWDRP